VKKPGVRNNTPANMIKPASMSSSVGRSRRRSVSRSRRHVPLPCCTSNAAPNTDTAINNKTVGRTPIASATSANTITSAIGMITTRAVKTAAMIASIDHSV